MIERTASAGSSKDVSHTTSPPEVESSVEIGTNSPVPVRFLFWCNLQSYIFFGSKALWDKKKKNMRAHLCLLGPSKEYILVDWRFHLSSVRQSGSWSGVLYVYYQSRKRLCETHLWKTQRGTVRSITNIYSLPASLYTVYGRAPDPYILKTNIDRIWTIFYRSGNP